MTGCGFQCDASSALECLISLSDDTKNEENVFDEQIVTSGWDEVSCGWRNTKPNAHYAVYPGKRKRSKEKFQISPEPDSQLAKVKKLAGMIAHSNNNSSTKLKAVRNSALIKYQNCGVLSYDTPCWRFVVDPKIFTYIERPTFLELRSSINERKTTHTIILENGGMMTCQEINGRMAVFDPAYYFDKHLLGTYIDREEFRLRACQQRPLNCSFDYKTSFSQTISDENKICVVQTVTIKPTLEPCSSLCDMCRHRTQELNSDKCIGKTSSSSDLKPLVKVTPTQRKIAEDSRLQGKVLVHQGKDINLKSFKVSKKAKESLHSRHVSMRLDWLPITRSTIAYPCDTTASERVSNDKFPGRASQAKAFAFPKGHGTKARKLTLSEAANLVPRASKLGHAIDKLTKDLESKQDKPIAVTEPVLPSVSGTKLEVSLSSGYCNM